MNQIPNIEETSSRELEIVEDFNKFIKKWCGNNFPHLIDSDENDGEEFRDKLRDLHHQLQKAREQAYKDGARDVRDFAQVEIMKRASQLRDDITTFTSEQIHSELDQPTV